LHSVLSPLGTKRSRGIVSSIATLFGSAARMYGELPINQGVAELIQES
jgi:hypothetical protein